MHVTDIGVWMFLDGSCINVVPLLVSYVTCLCVTGMSNIITVPILECVAIISHFTVLVVIVSILDSTVWFTNPFLSLIHI